MYRSLWTLSPLPTCTAPISFGLMNDFASPRDIEASLKIHLVGQGVATPFVNVHQMPGKEAPIYVITTESSLASLLQQFLEARIGRSCPYAQGYFLLHAREAKRLLG